MAKQSPDTRPSNDTGPAPTQEYLHEPFMWTRTRTPQAMQLSTIRDVVGGAHALAEFLTWDESNVAMGLTKLLAPPTHGMLQRLLVGSLDLLYAELERQTDSLDAREAAGG